MRYVFGFLMLLSLCACAGNPPAWWNPSGSYPQTENTATKQTTQTVPAPAVQPAIPAEESIDPVYEDSYEENLPVGVLLNENKNPDDFAKMPEVPDISETKELPLTPSVLQ